ncbi:MAG: DUF3780 domain-containing protein [Deltaproteobacteria bacterium]|nr:DUF3780 domain-containing protein [Deltaproteobacteria bacterium]
MSRDDKRTVGFGCPDTVDPHFMMVNIPQGRTAPVVLVEHFGLRAEHDRLPDELERVELDRQKWSAIADTVRMEFNHRLKEKDIATGRWRVGENRVERLLGKELCVLAWAVEHADIERIPVAITNWLGLKPEERWWLFTMTAAATGGIHDGDVGWRKALRFALTENPTDAEAATQREQPRTRRTKKQLATNAQAALFPPPEDS